MPAKDFELILRVQADLQTAVGELRALNDQMRVVKTSATEASGGLQSLTSSARATEAGVRGVSAQLKGMGASASAMASQFKALAASVISLLALREIAGFVKQVIDADSALGDMAKKVGVSTEALSALGSVAKRNGSDLDAVQSGFVKLARAATGLDQTGVRALQAMNVNLKQFRDLSPQDQFDLVAQKFAGYQDGANKAALATALFGRAGADLIPTLNEVGQQGLQALTDKAIASGTAVGQNAADAATKFNNALQDLKEKLQGAVNQGLMTFNPQIEAFADRINDEEFQRNLKDTAVGIISIGEAALKAGGYIGQAASGLASLVHYGQFLKSGEINQGDTPQQQNNEFQTLVQRRQDLQAQLDLETKFHGDPSKNQLAIWLQGQLKIVDGQMRAAQDARKAAELAAHPGGAEAGLAARDKVLSGKDVPAWMKVGLGASKSKAPIVGDGSSNAAADQLAKQAAKAQDDITQALIRLQGQLDPTAAAYAAYNATVKKATDDAELAKQAKGADAAAIDSQRDAVIGLAGTIRDAALDQLAEKDRQAWEALKRSFETPAQVAVDDALKKIAQLNELLKKGGKSSADYHDMLAKIGAASVTAAPQYQGPGAAVGGPYGELQKNFQAMDALEAWHQQQLDANKSFHAKDAAEEEAHQARLAEIDRQYSAQRTSIERSRQTLILGASAQFFDNIAQLSSSHNRKIAAIGKAAAIASTLIKAYQSGTEARAALSGIPIIGPALGIAAEVAAIAAGLANVAQMRSQNVGSYATGGAIRGPGTGTSDSVPILASNGEYMHTAAAVQYYGLPMMDAINKRMFPRFAEGGLIPPHPLANAPSPAQLGFTAPTPLPLGNVAGSAANDDPRASQPPPVHVFAVFDPAELADKVMDTGPGHKVIVNVAGNNPNAIKAKWGGG